MLYIHSKLKLINMIFYPEQFNPSYYLQAYPDLKAAFKDNLEAAASHFFTHGIYEGRSPNPFFVPFYYHQQNTDLVFPNNGQPIELYTHWLTKGIDQGRSGSPIFDPKYYLTTWPDVANNFGANNFRAAYDHFMNFGINEGRKTVSQFAGPVLLNDGSLNPNATALFASVTIPVKDSLLANQTIFNAIADARALANFDPHNIGNQIVTDQCLFVNDYIQSPGGEFRAVMQADGNFVIYQRNGIPTFNYMNTLPDSDFDWPLYHSGWVWGALEEAHMKADSNGDHFAKLDADGAFRVYRGTRAAWAVFWCNNFPFPGDSDGCARLLDDGDFAIYIDKMGGNRYYHTGIGQVRRRVRGIRVFNKSLTTISFDMTDGSSKFTCVNSNDRGWSHISNGQSCTCGDPEDPSPVRFSQLQEVWPRVSVGNWQGSGQPDSVYNADQHCSYDKDSDNYAEYSFSGTIGFFSLKFTGLSK